MAREERTRRGGVGGCGGVGGWWGVDAKGGLQAAEVEREAARGGAPAFDGARDTEGRRVGGWSGTGNAGRLLWGDVVIIFCAMGDGGRCSEPEPVLSALATATRALAALPRRWSGHKRPRTVLCVCQMECFCHR